MIRRFLLGLMLGFLLLCLPNLWMRLTTTIDSVASVAPAEATLIFGALVRDSLISPLHAERLDTGVDLWRAGKTETLVVSNAAPAAKTMRDYLLDKGVPAEAIALDPNAQHTPATCRNEARRNAARSVILLSQSFHLPRIALQCAEFDLDAQFVAADRSNRAPADLLTLAKTRTYRFLRESLYTWAALTGLYAYAENADDP